MDYAHISKLLEEDFRRLTGVKPPTFEAMATVLREAEEKRRKKRRYRGGRPPALSIENQRLLTLDDWREYRTMFHIAQSFQVSESVAWRTLIGWKTRSSRAAHALSPVKKRG